MAWVFNVKTEKNMFRVFFCCLMSILYSYRPRNTKDVYNRKEKMPDL